MTITPQILENILSVFFWTTYYMNITTYHIHNILFSLTFDKYLFPQTATGLEVGLPYATAQPGHDVIVAAGHLTDTIIARCALLHALLTALLTLATLTQQIRPLKPQAQVQA